MKNLLFCPSLLLAAGTLALADGAAVPAEGSDAKTAPRAAHHDEKRRAGLSEAQKEEFVHTLKAQSEQFFLEQNDPGRIFYDGDIPFAYLPLAERWEILRNRRISFSEYQYNALGKTLGDVNGKINPAGQDVIAAELNAKRLILAQAIRNALEVCASEEEFRVAAEEVKKFILDIIAGDADWRKRQEAAETARIVAETPEGGAREKELRLCRDYYSRRRIAVAEAEHSMSSALSRIYVKLLFCAFPNDWESVIREFDASLLMRWDTRERLHFVSETYRKEADPAFPQENRIALGRIRELELALRENAP